MFQLRPSTFRLFALSASLALGATSIARADSAPGQSPAQADANLDAANARANQARTAADLARTRVSDLSSKLDVDRLQAKAIRDRMLDAGSGLRELQAAADAAGARLDARHQEIAAEGARYAPVRDAYEQAKVDAIREFNESPEYRAAVDAVNSVAANLNAAQTESARQLAMTKLTAAKTALDDLRRRFTDELLAQNPKVVAAERPLKLEQAQYDALVAAATAAEQQLAGAQAALKSQTDGLAANRVGLDELTAEISKFEAELPGAQADSDQASAELESAAAYANAARQARDAIYAAAQPVTPPPTVVYQTSPYAYYPPAVVYVQPGGVYVGSGYYRNAFVQPRVYPYGSGVVHFYPSRVSGSHHGGHR